MKRLTYATLAALAVSAGTTVILSAQAKPASPPPAPASPAAPAKMVPPVRGEASIDVTKPASKRNGNMVLTTIKVKNTSNGSIAGLKVQEFWYDKAGNLVNGTDERVPKPLLPGQVHTFNLNTPYNDKMYSNTYTFTHANGKIKTKSVAKVE
jgi:hypothetical protein